MRGGGDAAVVRETLAGIVPALARSEETVRLRNVPITGISPEVVAGPFHSGSQEGGVPVRLQSSDSKNRILTLCVVSSDLRFRDGWAKWTLPARRVSDLKGGDAANAQDGVADDGSCHVLLLPGESREAFLSFDVPLDDVNGPGDLDLFVEVTDEAKATAGTTRLPLRIRLRHPESSFLRQLPSMYGEAMLDLLQEQDDKTQPPFFERYLRGFEDGIEPLWAALDHVERVIGPYTAPAAFLPFLATWTAMPFEESLSEMARRRYLAEAVSLVRWRGTARGLRHLLRIVTGGDIRIDEASVEGMKLGGEALLGASGTKLGNVGAHFFRVTLTVAEPDKLDLRGVHRAITWCKPAHTIYELVVVGLNT